MAIRNELSDLMLSARNNFVAMLAYEMDDENEVS